VLSLRAAKALLAKRSKDRRAAYDALTTHPMPKVRARIATEIAGLGGERARSVVLNALATEKAPEAVAALISAIGKLRGEAAFDALRQAIEQTTLDPYLHGVALETLGKARDARDLERLKGHLADVGDWSDWRWQKALLGLGWTRQREAKDILLAHLEPNYPQRIRATAAVALGRLGKHHEDMKGEVREALCHDLNAKGMRVQLGHLSGLVALGDAGAIPALQKLRKDASDGRVMRVAYEACVRLGEGKGGNQALAAEVERLRGALDAVTARLALLESPTGQ